MNYFHLEAKVVSRGAGRSVIAAAAYASCSRLYNDYDGLTHDYTRKHGCLYSEVFLPQYAPEEWKDRQLLWEAVESVEKTKDSRLARELVVALPSELSLDDWKSMLKRFVREQGIDLGMCADVNIHDPYPPGHNPHSHILFTMRPLDEHGKWQTKTQKEYLCKRGGEERGFTADEFKTAKTQGWEKKYMYQFGEKRQYLTPSEAEKIEGCIRTSKTPKSTRYGRQNPLTALWNSEEQIFAWRKSWEMIVNEEQTVFIKTVNELVSVIGIYSGQRIQDSGKIGHQNRNTFVQQGICNAASEKGFTGSHISPEKQSQRVRFHFFPMGHILMGFLHFRIVAFIIGKVVIMQGFVLQSVCPQA